MEILNDDILRGNFGGRQMELVKASATGFPANAYLLVEMLGSGIGRVFDASLVHHIAKPNMVVTPILKNDIVRLSHEPGKSDQRPQLVEIIRKAGPRFESEIRCHTIDQLYRLTAIASVLRARLYVHKRRRHAGCSLTVYHDEAIDLPRIAKAAGLTNKLGCPTSPPINLCKVPYYGPAQASRMIALAVVVGAEVIYVTRKPKEVVLFCSDEIDIETIAAAARIADKPSRLLKIGVPHRRPGAQPGTEWAAGEWGK